MTRILLVDDDRAAIIDSLLPILTRDGYHVDYARLGPRAIQIALIQEPDLVILSIGPEDGERQFCRRLLTFSDSSLLLLSSGNEGTGPGGWTWAPTTVWLNRLTWLNWWRGCELCFAGIRLAIPGATGAFSWTASWWWT